MAKKNNVPDPAQFSTGDQSDNIANANQVIEFYHIPSGQSVRFKAFVTAFEDQYSSNWETTNTYGRMDPVATFQNTQRQISVAFDVPAASQSEATENLGRISSLIQFTYPTYEAGDFGASTISSSPLLKMSFMNWIQRSDESLDGSPSSMAKSDGLIGFLGGVNYTPDMEMGVFYDDIGSMLPKLYRLNLNFTVIHSEKLGWIGENPSNTNFPYNYPQLYSDFTSEEVAKKTLEQQKKSGINRTLNKVAGSQIAGGTPRAFNVVKQNNRIEDKNRKRYGLPSRETTTFNPAGGPFDTINIPTSKGG